MRSACYFRLIAGCAVSLATICGAAQTAPPASAKAVADVWQWDVATGHTLTTPGAPPQTALYAWSADGAIQAIATSQEIQVANRDHALLPLAVPASDGHITAITLNRAGNEAAAATSGGYVLIWNDFQAAPIVATQTSPEEISCLAFNSSGGWLASGGRSIDVWETRGGKRVRPSTPAASWVTALAFGPSDELTTGDFSGHLHIFNSTGAEAVNTLAASGSVTALTYSPDGTLMAAGGTDGEVKVWGVDRTAPIAVLKNEAGRVLALSFHSTKTVIAVATDNNQVSTWDIASQRRLRIIPLGNNSAVGISFRSNDLLSIGLQAAPPPRVATLHLLVLLGGSKSTGAAANAARADALAVADIVQKAGRAIFGRIDQERLPIDNGTDADRVRDAFKAIARDSHPEDSLFVYYAGPPGPVQNQPSPPLIFANGGTVALPQVAHWLEDVAASTQTIVLEGAGATAQEDALRGILATDIQKQPGQQRKRLFLAFDRPAEQTGQADRSPATAMLIDGLSGQADQSPRDGRVTAKELRAFLDLRTLSIAASGFKGKYEFDGDDDFDLVSQNTTRGISPEPEPGTSDPATIFQTRHDYALLIATDEYDAWSHLPNPVQDAKAVEAELRDKYGFEVKLLENPTKRDIIDELTRYHNLTFQPGDQLLIFIAGHGDFDGVAKEGYMVAKDSQLPTDDPTRGSMIPHSQLRSYVDTIPVKHVLVIMDVCFGGTFDRGIAEAGSRGGMYEDQPVDQLFTERAQWTTRKFITSGGKQYVPDGAPGHNSPFVHNLLAELRNPSKDRGYLTFADLQSAVQGTSPAPVWGTWGQEEAGSDFFLISKNFKAPVRTPANSAPIVEATFVQRKSVCFIGLKNALGDPSVVMWGSAITEQMTGGGLGAGEKLRVVSSEDVGRVKRDLGLEDLSSYSRDTLLRIRQNTGADVVIAGSFIATKEGLLSVTFQIQDAIGGQTIGAILVTGTQTGIVDLTGQASAQLLAKLGVSDLSAEQLAAVKAGMPTNTEAIKNYSGAMVLLHKGDARGARDLLSKADAAQPGISFIHRGLADAWQLLGYDRNAIAEAAKAAEFAQGLPREDMYSIQARENFLSGQLPKAIEQYRYLTMTEPDNLEYGLDLVHAEAYGRRGSDALEDIAELEKPGAPFAGDPRIMLEQANTYNALGEFPKVLDAARQAQQSAATRGARMLEAQANVSICWAQRNLGHRDDAVPACQRAIDIYQSVGDKRGMANAQTNLGNTLADSSDYAGALAKYRAAAELTDSIGDRGDRAGALLNIARMQIFLGRYADADSSLNELTPLATEVGDSGTLGKAYFYRADIAHRNGDMAKAQESIADVLRIGEDEKDENLTARAYSFQASYGLEAGNLNTALASADKCIEIRTRIVLPTGVATCQQTRGQILMAQNRLPEAQTAYGAAAHGFEAIQEPENEAEVWIAQAELSAEAGAPAEGELLARRASAEFAKEKDFDSQASALSALLHCLVAQGKQSEAGQTAQALEQLHPTDPDTLREVALAEARFHAMLGTFDAALAQVGQARDSCKRSGRVDCELQARLLEDQIRLQSGKADGLAAEFQALTGDAARLGFNLIAGQAAKALASPPARTVQ